MSLKNMKDKNKNILILTGGEVEDAVVSRLTNNEGYAMYIAADRGLMVADRLDLPLDYILGDFDSISEELLMKYRKKSIPILTFPAKKDKTDTEIAIEMALSHNPARIDIVGATGSRLDHTLANIHLLMLPLQHNTDAFIIDANNKLYLKKTGFELKKKEQYGDYVSFLTFTEKVSGLTLTGFKYPLNKVTLLAGNSLGISNEIDEDTARVDLSEGILLVIESRD